MIIYIKNNIVVPANKKLIYTSQHVIKRMENNKNIMIISNTTNIAKIPIYK